MGSRFLAFVWLKLTVPGLRQAQLDLLRRTGNSSKSVGASSKSVGMSYKHAGLLSKCAGCSSVGGTPPSKAGGFYDIDFESFAIDRP